MTTLALSHKAAELLATSAGYTPYNFELGTPKAWASDDLAAIEGPGHILEMQDEMTRSGATGNVIATVYFHLIGRAQVGTFHHTDLAGILAACADEAELAQEWIDKHF